MAERTVKSQFAPDRDNLPSPEDLGVTLAPDALELAHDSEKLAEAYGPANFKAVVQNKVAFLSAICSCVGGLLFGFDQGLVSIILVMPHFLKQFPEVDEAVTSSASLNKGIMTGLLELGAFMGALMAGYVADRYSRKASIGFGITWFAIGSTLQTASFGLPQLIVGRFIGGVGIGVLSTTSPMYISEVAPPNIRGGLLAMGELSIVIGIVVMFYITYATRHIVSEWSFRLPFLLQMVPALPLAIALFFLPYSPRWLASKGRDKECLQTLCRLRNLPDTDARVQAEWLTIRAEACRNRETLVQTHPTLISSPLKLEVASWIDMFRPAVIRRTMIGIVLMIGQQFSGINALIYYSPTLFQQLGLDSELQLTFSGVMNVAQLVAVIFPCFFLDRIGRKPPLVLGGIAMALCHFVVGGLTARYASDWPAHPAAAWTAAGFIIGFMLPFGLSWGPVPWALPSEIFPSSRRAKGLAITTCTNWFFNFIIGVITPPLISGTGYGTFLFFGIWSTLAGLWAFFFVPETRGVTLEQMDKVFGSHTAHDDLIAKDDILNRLTGTTLSVGSVEQKYDSEWVEKV